MNAIVAVIILICVRGGLGYFYGRLGNFSFWKLVTKIPDEAYHWSKSEPTWFVSEEGDEEPPTRGEYTGPFRLAVPSLGRTIKIYCRNDQIEQSQNQFLEKFKTEIPIQRFPILSLLALLYPIAAMLSATKYAVPTTIVLGYGFSNLGYLLGVAFLFAGHFRILGLDSRPPTLIVAVVAWLVGVLLSNIQ